MRFSFLSFCKRRSRSRGGCLFVTFVLGFVIYFLAFHKIASQLSHSQHDVFYMVTSGRRELTSTVNSATVAEANTSQLVTNSSQNETKPTVVAGTINSVSAETKPLPPDHEIKLASLQSTENFDATRKLRDFAQTMNENESIINAGDFPRMDLVIIVQVHRRIHYLKELITSLRAARNIEEVLVVFSYDYYDTEIIAEVEKIDFCKIGQIFYPHSIQLYPDEFPGVSQNDCPKDISRDRAHELNCSNAEYPDGYGHYREATVTAIKHHWWWKINQIFDELNVTSSYDGYIVFLEEDLYVAPDLIPVTHQLISLVKSHCESCDLIGLGISQLRGDYAGYANKANVLPWRNNMAYAIDRRSWNKIKDCSKEFCTYDDYNWDWTLQSLQATCYHRPLQAVMVKSPRVFHLGSCGTHQRNHGDGCNWDESMTRVRNHIDANKHAFFPSEVVIDSSISIPGVRSRNKGFGGWADPRDHELCRSYVHR